MAYCRNNGVDSDVYLLPTPHGIWCCGCKLFNTEKTYKTRRGAFQHLLNHRLDGHKVPQFAFERLQDEIVRLGNRVVRMPYV